MPSLPERLFAALTRASAVVVAAVPLAVVGVLAWTGIGGALAPHLAPPIVGLAQTASFTLAVVATAAIVGGAVGVGCAIAAEELAPAAFRAAIEAAIGFLAAMPAVAIGWFAAYAVAPFSEAHSLGRASQFVAAAVVLAAMTAPTACGLVTRALRRVPDAMRQAAGAAGASRLQTTALVIVPALGRRIAAAVLASFARAIGEATALQMLFFALYRHGFAPASTTASLLFEKAAFGLLATTFPAASLAALALLAVAAGCSIIVSREYRGMQWA